MILDIGCGAGQDWSVQINRDDVIHADLERGYDHLEVVCDMQHLPFRDGAFTHLHASHILEHIPHPVTALQECRRVAEHCVFKVPTLNRQRYHSRESQEHLYSWSISTFKHLLHLVFDHVSITETWIQRLHTPLFESTIRFLVQVVTGEGHTELVARCR